MYGKKIKRNIIKLLIQVSAKIVRAIKWPTRKEENSHYALRVFNDVMNAYIIKTFYHSFW